MARSKVAESMWRLGRHTRCESGSVRESAAPWEQLRPWEDRVENLRLLDLQTSIWALTDAENQFRDCGTLSQETFDRVAPLVEEEPAHTAGRIVMWYAGRMWTLWVPLITLPLAVLVSGCVTLLRSCIHVSELHPARQGLAAIYADRSMLFVVMMTLTAGVVLAIVATHMAAN